MLATISIQRSLVWVSVITLVLSFVFFGLPIFAAQETDLRGAIEKVEADIAKNEAVLADLEKESDTLRNRISQLEAEISTANQRIELTSLKIKQLTEEIKETEEELENRKRILSESVRTLYKRGDSTTFELLITSDGYSDFIDQQEYLSRLKSAIQESAVKVADLKTELEDHKTEQEELLNSQQAQRTVLREKRSEQANLLAQTEGQEAKYQKIVSSLDQQRKQAEKELQDFLAAQNYTSLGYVNAGTNIGQVGSSGFSTGPHIHFAIYDGSSFLDPGGSGGNLNYGFQWPVPNSSAANISQWYGCTAPPGWYIQSCNNGQNSFHSGLDISGWYGDPVVAAASGDIIFRGWLGGYGNTVIIQHQSGLFTYYPHLLK